MTPLTRRGLIAGAAGSAALVALEACGSSSKSAATPTGTPTPKAPKATAAKIGGVTDPSKAPFDTVVVLMMENRSFDHLLGWVPGVNGKQAGLTFPGAQGRHGDDARPRQQHPGLRRQGSVAHWQSMVKHYNGGKCDGWLRTQFTGDHFPIGYYDEEQVPILGALAKNYTLFDSYHCSLMAATWPNRFYQLCAATDVDETGLFPAAGAAAAVQARARHLRPLEGGRTSPPATTRGASR